MSQITNGFKKSAIVGADVTLVPSTVTGAGESHPPHLAIATIVLTVPQLAPPAEFWGTSISDGAEYEVIIRRVT